MQIARMLGTDLFFEIMHLVSNLESKKDESLENLSQEKETRGGN